MTSPRAPSVPAPGTRPTVGNVTLRFGTDAAGRPHSALRLVRVKTLWHVAMPCVRPPSPPRPREGNRGADVSSPNGRPSTGRAGRLDPPRESGLPWPDAASSLGSLTLRACEAAGGAGRGSGARARGSRTHLDSFGGLVTRRQPAGRPGHGHRAVRPPSEAVLARPPPDVPRARSGLSHLCRVRGRQCPWTGRARCLFSWTLSSAPACPSLQASGLQGTLGPALGLAGPANAFPGFSSRGWPLQWPRWSLPPELPATMFSATWSTLVPWGSGEPPSRGGSSGPWCGGLPASF